MTMTTPSTELDKAIERLENELAISGSDVDQFSRDIQTACNAVKRCQQLELDVKLGIESQQEICKERDDLQGGRIDLARQSLALKEQLSQLRESQQALVKERDSFATTIHQQHFGRYGIVELQQQLSQLRAEYKKALDALERMVCNCVDDYVCKKHEVLTTPLAIETMKDQTI